MTMCSSLYVLIACEESQAECQAFRRLGHSAFSCDVQTCRLNPDWHIHGDVTPYLVGKTDFVTQSGISVKVPRWDLIICHPPCTYLCRVSSVQMVQHGVLNQQRYAKMLEAREFFFKCLNAQAPYVAVENPIPMKRAMLPRPQCYCSPHWYGVKYSKKTLWWTKNLPALMPSIIYPNPKCFVRCSRGKYRSRIFPQMAEAIANQWASFILDDLAKLK